MRPAFRLLALVIAILASQLSVAQAPAGAPAGATGLCKDGTYATSAAKKSACRGHKGIKDWYADTTPASAKKPAAAADSAPAPAPATSSAPSAPAPVTKPAASTAAPAAGGGAGQVWVNTASNVYHCPGTRWYGKTKAGAYMTEAEAKAKGARPDRGKACN